MSRYFSKPKASRPRADDDWYDPPGFLPDLVVSDHEAVDTGLVDHRGDSIYRAPYPIGFGRDDEW